MRRNLEQVSKLTIGGMVDPCRNGAQTGSGRTHGSCVEAWKTSRNFAFRDVEDGPSGWLQVLMHPKPLFRESHWPGVVDKLRSHVSFWLA